MAVTFIKRSAIPVAMKGKEGSLSVAVGGNGSITFSTKATKHLGNPVKVAIAFDSDSRKLFVVPKGSKSVAKLAETEFFDVRHSKKGGTCALSGGASFLKAKEVFGDATYDYAGSGNQSFSANEEKEGISFVLPAGTVAKRPTVARKPRKKKDVPAGTPANPGSTVAANASTVADDELVLEPA